LLVDCLRRLDCDNDGGVTLRGPEIALILFSGNGGGATPLAPGDISTELSLGLFVLLMEVGLVSLVGVEVFSMGGDLAAAVAVEGGLNVLVLVVIRLGPVSLRVLECLVNVLALLETLISSSSLSFVTPAGFLGVLGLAVLLAVLEVRVAVSLTLGGTFGGGTRVPPLFVEPDMSLFRVLLVG